jgi:hypothetical protein
MPMSRPGRDVQARVLGLLRDFRGLEPLKQLFWSELNYERVAEPLPRGRWPSRLAAEALPEDPLLFARGGNDGAFHVI